MRHFLSLVSAAVLTSLLPAQNVVQVPPGADLQMVHNAASPGDVLQLSAGSYSKLTVSKSLTIVGPATLGFTFTPLDVVIALPPNGVVRFVDLTITTDISLPGFTPYGNVKVQSGSAVFEGCAISGFGTMAGAVDVQPGAHAVFRHCELTSTGLDAALTSTDGDVVATDTSFFGSNSGFADPGTPGIRASGTTGFVHLGSCTVKGGDSSTAIIPQPAGVGMVSDVDTWIVDSMIEGGSSLQSPGADALHAMNTTIARTQLVPGSGSVSGNPSVGTVHTDPNMLGVSSTPPAVVVAGNAQLTYTTGTPGALIAVMFSVNSPIPPIRFEPLVAQPLWAIQMTLASTLTADGTGTAVLNLPVPNRATLKYQSFGLFGLALDGARVQVAPGVVLMIQ